MALPWPDYPLSTRLMHIQEWVSTDALPRSTKLGRMQVMLEIGRQVQEGKGFAIAPWFFQC